MTDKEKKQFEKFISTTRSSLFDRDVEKFADDVLKIITVLESRGFTRQEAIEIYKCVAVNARQG